MFGDYSLIDFTVSPAAFLKELIQKKGAAGGFPAAPFF
jgi:hypothetical protein